MILARLHQLSMGLEPYLKDFVRPRVLNDRSRSGRSTVTNQEKTMELMIFFKLIQNQVFGLLLKPLHKRQHIELGLNIYY